MKWKNRPQSDNFEDRRDGSSREASAKAKLDEDSQFNQGLKDKAPLKQSKRISRGSAGTTEGAKKMTQLWDSHKPTRLSDSIFPK